MTELVMTDAHRIHERTDEAPVCPFIRIYSFEGELFFGSAPEFESHLEAIEHELGPEAYVLALRVKYLRNPDAVCMHLLKEFIDRVESRGIRVCLSGVRDEFYTTLTRVGIVDQLGPERVFREVPQLWTSTAAAIEWAHAQLAGDVCETCPRAEHSADDAAPWHFVI
jgi:SulP family sulfate permease